MYKRCFVLIIMNEFIVGFIIAIIETLYPKFLFNTTTNFNIILISKGTFSIWVFLPPTLRL
jgi:hypothetical protein